MKFFIVFFTLVFTVFGTHLFTKLDLSYERDVEGWNVEGQIVGGQLADVGEYPSQVSVMYNGNHTCGGTIINENFIVTAAHCNFGSENVIVRAGTNKWDEPGSDHETLRFIVHPGWDPMSFASADILLIQVSPPIVFNELTQPAKLPAQDQETPAGSDAVIVGWGMKDNINVERPVDLREGFVNVRDHQQCFDIYEAEVEITDAQMCADKLEGGVGTCGGDSGGPLYVDGEFIGIASWISRGCGFPGYPGMFTRVASYVDWINENSVY